MSELRLSADGLYYWDGRQWVSTLSPDGRYRWTGAAWAPLAAVAPPHYQYYPAQKITRTPTRWTAPMQAVVAGLFVVYALYTLSTPFWGSGLLTQAFNQSLQRQQQLNPAVSPPPAEMISSMTTMMSGILWMSVIFTVAISAVAVAGALRRWTWAFWAILVLFGIVTVFLPFNVGSAAMGASAANLYGLPVWTVWLSIAFELVTAAVFAWMLVTLIRIGPWATTRTAEAPAAPAQAPAS